MFLWLILAWAKQDADVITFPNTCWNSPSLNVFVFVFQSWLQVKHEIKNNTVAHKAHTHYIIKGNKQNIFNVSCMLQKI